MLVKPRARIPVLMLNGRDDFMLPYETSQRPLFEALGTKDKVLKRYDGGHLSVVNRPDLMREILDWFDKYPRPGESAAIAVHSSPTCEPLCNGQRRTVYGRSPESHSVAGLCLVRQITGWAGVARWPSAGTSVESHVRCGG